MQLQQNNSSLSGLLAGSVHELPAGAIRLAQYAIWQQHQCNSATP